MVLRELKGPSQETRRRVLRAAQDLGYYPDRSARLLRGHRRYLLGVLFSMHEPFEVDLVEELSTVASRHGYSLVLGPWSSTRSQVEVVDELLEQRIEVLFVLSGEEGQAVIDGLPQGLPTVQVGGPVGDAADDDVRVDNLIGIDMLVEHLRSQGHQNIAYVSGGTGPNASAREQAYRKAMTNRRLKPSVVAARYSEEAGYRAAHQILEQDALPTAIMAANDRCAVGVLAALSEHRLGLPGKISVTGFDDSSVAAWPFVQLTTVRVDPAELAELAVRAAISRISGDDIPPLRFRTRPVLVIRSSTGPAA